MSDSDEKEKKIAELEKRLKNVIALHDGALSAHRMHQEMYEAGKGDHYKRLASKALDDAGKYLGRANEIKTDIAQLKENKPS